MEKLSFSLSDFEGPLELLLHLIQKHKLDILNIEISELLRQYLAFIENRTDQTLEVQSEFLEMAARLVHIKTVMLLPRHEDEADQLRTQLTGELMEYQLCRVAAEQLGRLAQEHRVFVRFPMRMEADMTYPHTHPAALLFEATQTTTGRQTRKAPPPESAFSGIVKRKVVSVNSRIIYLLRHLYREPVQRLEKIFGQGDRSELVATFLALLELIKGGRVMVSDNGDTITFNRGRNQQQEVSG